MVLALRGSRTSAAAHGLLVSPTRHDRRADSVAYRYDPASHGGRAPSSANPACTSCLSTDDGWGADQVRFSNDGGATWGTGAPVQTYMSWYLFEGKSAVLRLDGPRTVTAQFSNDGGETWGPVASATTLFDGQAPVVTAPSGYWNNHYSYKLSARDQVGLSGVQYLWYRVDAGELVQVTSGASLGTSSPLKAAVTLDGNTGTPHTVDYFAADFAGNVSGRVLAVRASKAVKKNDVTSLVSSAYVVIDRTAPSVTARGWDGDWHSNAGRRPLQRQDRGDAGSPASSTRSRGKKATKRGRLDRRATPCS